MYQEKQCATDLMSASCCGDIYQTYIRAKQNEVQQDLYTCTFLFSDKRNTWYKIAKYMICYSS